MSDDSRRILVTEGSRQVVKTILSAANQCNTECKVVQDGEECLQLIGSYRPQLIIFDMAAAKLHGMELLKQLKGEQRTAEIGVIITAAHAIAQDYNTALAYGADYCLLKPFDTPTISHIIESFYSGTLKPEPFHKLSSRYLEEAEPYQPKPTTWSSYIKFWGTRGSIPVAGMEFHRYGGNTSCLEVRDQEHLVIIDAGTGIRGLGDNAVEEGIKEFHLFFGHTHWDHIIGFPFFAPVYNPGNKIHIYAGRGFHRSIQELFTGMLDHDFFPVRFEDMQAEFIFHDLADFKPIKIGGLLIHYQTASHPGNTLCFKIESGNRTVGYATDNEFLVGYHGHPEKVDRHHPLLEPYIDVVNFFSGCDVLVHEAQYTPEEYLQKMGWGHSSISNASILLKHCKAPEWVITHHDPANDDDRLIRNLEMQREVLAECKVDTRCFMAYDGLAISLN